MVYAPRYTTDAQVRAYCPGADDDAPTEAEMLVFIEQAERWTEQELNGGETLVTAETATTETASGRLLPRTFYRPEQYHISEITSLTVDGKTLTEDTDYYVEGDIIWLDSKMAFDWRNLVLVYKHGYASDSIPAWLTELAGKKAAVTVLNQVKKQESDRAYWSERSQYEKDIKDLVRQHKRVYCLGGF